MLRNSMLSTMLRPGVCPCSPCRPPVSMISGVSVSYMGCGGACAISSFTLTLGAAAGAAGVLSEVPCCSLFQHGMHAVC